MHSESYYIGREPIKDFIVEVQKGNVPGHSIVNKFGSNPEIRNGISETVFDGAGIYTFPDLATRLDIDSSNNDDRTASTGATKVTLQGLNASYEEIEEEVSMNGTSTINTTNSFLRLNRAFVSEAGSNGTNIGNITIASKATGTPTVGVITAGLGQTQMAVYTVPAGKTAYWLSWSGAIVKKNAGIATLDFVERTEAGVVKVKSSMSVSIDGSTTMQKDTYAQKFVEKTNLYVNAPYVSTTVSIFSNFTLLLVDNA